MYNNNYTNYHSKNYNRTTWKTKYDSAVKKKVKYFTDLDVYQKSQEAAVFCAGELLQAAQSRPHADLAKSDVENGTRIPEWEYNLVKDLMSCALSIPRLIAESHGKRFGTSQESLDILDTVMLNCNLMVVYLEQARDLLKLSIEHDRWEEQTKNYFFIRQKVLNLQRVWRKYITENQQQQ